MDVFHKFLRLQRTSRLGAGTRMLMALGPEEIEFEQRLRELRERYMRELRARVYQNRTRALARRATEMLARSPGIVVRIARRRAVRHVRAAPASTLSAADPDPALSFISTEKESPRLAESRRFEGERDAGSTTCRRRLFA